MEVDHHAYPSFTQTSLAIAGSARCAPGVLHGLSPGDGIAVGTHIRS